MTSRGPRVIEILCGVSVLGATAIAWSQGFAEYALRMRTTEAVQHLSYLFRMSSVYVTSERVTRPRGAVVPVQFPRSVRVTPALSRIGSRPITDPPGTWNAPTWQALSFSVADPHYFAYAYDSLGTGPSSAFSARAHGDLDGDRAYSTFARGGHLNAQLEVEGPTTMFRVNELE